jgi:hypothetical protein
MADHNFRSDRGQDPIAELARLIGQADPHGNSAPADRGWREGTASEGYEEPTRLPPGRLNAPEQAHELDQHRHDEKVCDAGDQPWAADEEYQNEAPHRRRRSNLPLVVTREAGRLTEGLRGAAPPESAVAGPRSLRYSVLRWWAPLAHPTTATCSLARFCRCSRRSSKRATNRMRSRPLLGSCKLQTAIPQAKPIPRSPARSRIWSHAKTNRSALGRRILRLMSVKAWRTNRCRAAQRRLRILFGLLMPRPIRRRSRPIRCS